MTAKCVPSYTSINSYRHDTINFSTALFLDAVFTPNKSINYCALLHSLWTCRFINCTRTNDPDKMYGTHMSVEVHVHQVDFLIQRRMSLLTRMSHGVGGRKDVKADNFI